MRSVHSSGRSAPSTEPTTNASEQRSDILISIERVRGSAFADDVIGDHGDNYLFGEGGNDSISGGPQDRTHRSGLDQRLCATLTKPRLFQPTAKICRPGGNDDNCSGNPFSAEYGPLAKGK